MSADQMERQLSVVGWRVIGALRAESEVTDPILASKYLLLQMT
jgi:hypothetical protein